jgi:hypothetical protein
LLREQAIETGVSNWEQTQVSSGLAEGALVVLSLDRAGVVADAAAATTASRITSAGARAGERVSVPPNRLRSPTRVLKVATAERNWASASLATASTDVGFPGPVTDNRADPSCPDISETAEIADCMAFVESAASEVTDLKASSRASVASNAVSGVKSPRTARPISAIRPVVTSCDRCARSAFNCVI